MFLYFCSILLYYFVVSCVFVSASKDGIDLGESGEYRDHLSETSTDHNCPTCGKTFHNIENLYSHQTELGHLELKQTPGGPGYLCWQKGCNQYFSKVQTLQVHFREIHLKKPPANMSISEKHSYKFRCTQCSLAFKTVEKLQMHSFYHIIREATKCFMCSKKSRTIGAMRKHVETVHLTTMTEVEKEKFAQILQATIPISLLGMPGLAEGGAGMIIPQIPTLQAMQAVQQGMPPINPFQLPLPIFNPSIPNDLSVSNLLTQQAANLSKSQSGEGFKESCTKSVVDEVQSSVGRSGTPASVTSEQASRSEDSEVDENSKDSFVDESINTIALAENSFSDPSKKYKCFRCKVAFGKQNLLAQHNRTSMHRNKVNSNKKDSELGHSKLNNNIVASLTGEGRQCVKNDTEHDNPLQQLSKDTFTNANSFQKHIPHLEQVKRLQSEVGDIQNVAKRQLVVSDSSTKVTSTEVKLLNGAAKPIEVTKVTNTQIIRQESSPPVVMSTSSQKGSKSQTLAQDISKPYKCNICKVAYSQAENLDAHLTSALHQTKTAKITELIVTGEVDNTQPLIEMPEGVPQLSPKAKEHSTNVLQEFMKSASMGGLPALPFGLPYLGMPSMVSQGNPLIPQMSVVDMTSVLSNMPNSPLVMPNIKTESSSSSSTFMSSEKSNIVSSAKSVEVNSTSVTSGKDNSRNDLSSVTGSQHAKESVASVSTSGSVTPTSKSTSSSKTPKEEEQKEQFICEKCNGQYQSAECLVQHQQMYCLMQMSTLKLKCHMLQGLLENFGFECVMQYNENHQKAPKVKQEPVPNVDEKKIETTGKDIESNDVADAPEKKDDQIETTENNDMTKLLKDKNGNDKQLVASKSLIPELEKSKCSTCRKQFSSVWVLKTHQEEVHKHMVSTDVVSVIAQQFREGFDKKYPQPASSSESGTPTAGDGSNSTLADNKEGTPTSGT